MKIKRKEIIIFVVLIVAALIAWAILSHQRSSREYGSIIINVGSRIEGVYSLGEDRTVSINDGSNTLEIKDGQARMTDATCPDHLCMSQEPIGDNGGFIICLPNQVFIEGMAVDGNTPDPTAPDTVAGSPG